MRQGSVTRKAEKKPGRDGQVEECGNHHDGMGDRPGPASSDRDCCCRTSRVKTWPVLTPEQRFAGRGEIFATGVRAEATPSHTSDVLAMRWGIDAARRGFCFRRPSLPREPMLVLEFSRHEAESRLHPDRASCRDRDHRRADRLASARRSSRLAKPRGGCSVSTISNRSGSPCTTTMMRSRSSRRVTSRRASSSMARPTPRRAGAGRR